MRYRLTVTEMLKFYKQYKADQESGSVLDIDVYVKKKLKGLSREDIESIADEIKILIRNDIIKDSKQWIKKKG